jgi:hypothetical protein
MDHGDSGGLSSAVTAGKGDFVNGAETLGSGSNSQFEGEFKLKSCDQTNPRGCLQWCLVS